MFELMQLWRNKPLKKQTLIRASRDFVRARRCLTHLPDRVSVKNCWTYHKENYDFQSVVRIDCIDCFECQQVITVRIFHFFSHIRMKVHISNKTWQPYLRLNMWITTLTKQNSCITSWGSIKIWPHETTTHILSTHCVALTMSQVL